MKIIERVKTIGRRLDWMLGGSNERASITNSADLLAEIQRSFTATSGVQVNSETAMRVSAVSACVRAIADNLASLPLILYRKTGAEEEEKERATDHELYPILRYRPTRRHTKVDWLGYMMAHALLRGNAYAMKARVRGRIDELLPINPNKVTPRLEAGEPIYRVYPENGGSHQDYTRKEIFHLPGLSTDGFCGRSVIADARETIGLAISQENYGASAYRGGGTKRMAISIPGELAPGAAERLQKQWEEIYGGPNNQGKVIFLEYGAEANVVSMTAQDMEYLESRNFQITDIARLFRVPLPLIQQMEKTTSWGTGVEQIMLGFVVFTLRPWIVRWEEAIQQQLLDGDESYFAEFLVDALLRGDIEKRSKAQTTYLQNGVFNIDEVRKMENKPPLPNGLGKIHRVQVSTMEVGAEPAPEPAAPPAAEPEGE